METKEIYALTDEQKSTLKNVLGFKVEDSFKYVPEVFRKKDDAGNYILPKEYWTVFTLRSKDGVEIAEVEDNSAYMTFDQTAKESKMHLLSGKTRIQTLMTGIKEVKRFWFEDGSIMDFDAKTKFLKVRNADGSESVKNGFDTKQFVRYMTTDLQVEIVNAINERKVLTVEETQGL
jgi:hypothetical protein